MTEEKKEQPFKNMPWPNQIKKLIHAGMGAVAVAQDEVESFINKMVDRGELAEKDGRKWIKEFLEKSKKQTKETVQGIEETSLDGLEKILDKFNIPTKQDFEQLSARVDKLTTQLQELLNQNESK